MHQHVAGMDVEAVIASHYATAQAHLASSTPDLVCVDIGLPTESGYELCEYIRRSLGLKFLPILVTSQFGSAAEMAHAEEAGANAFLKKPFSMLEFGVHLAALLDGAWPVAAQIFGRNELRAVHTSASLLSEASRVVRSESGRDPDEVRPVYVLDEYKRKVHTLPRRARVA
jgi:DNA-binding response OmpR family regulator